MVDEIDEYGRDASDREFEYRMNDDGFFLRSLESDVVRAEALVTAEPKDDFARRTLVRTVFAEVEGLCASAIDWSRYYASETSVFKESYTLAERSFLATRQVAKLNQRGEAEWQPTTYPTTKQTIRFALSLVGRRAATQPAIDYGDGGWEALCKGMAVRDRLMHPQTVDHVSVSDDDLAYMRRGRTWFIDTYKAQKAAMQATIAAELGPKLKQMMAEWRAKQEPPVDD